LLTDKISDISASRISTRPGICRELRNARAAIQFLGITGRHDVFHETLQIEGGPPELAPGPGSSPDYAYPRVRQLICDQFDFDFRQAACH